MDKETKTSTFFNQVQVEAAVCMMPFFTLVLSSLLLDPKLLSQTNGNAVKWKAAI